ncbi:MAG: DUF92 domain-containing protein [Bacteroidota bacterium]
MPAFTDTLWVRVVVALAAGGAFAAGTYRVRVLSRSGAVAGGGLAASLVAAGTLTWIAPAVTFFVLSSALSKVGRAAKAQARTHEAKGDVRDAAQVLANGGVAWGCLLLAFIAPGPAWYAAYVGAWAAAAADTWATELGTWLGGTPRSVLTGARLTPGASGGVTGVGTLASVAGAASVGLAAWATAPASHEGGALVAGVVLAGGLGALADSVLGATVQARYRDRLTDTLTERADAGPLVRGWSWVNNETVNAACTLVGAIGGYIFYLLLARL